MIQEKVRFSQSGPQYFSLSCGDRLHFELTHNMANDKWALRTNVKRDGIWVMTRIHEFTGSVLSVGIDLSYHMLKTYNIEVDHKLC
jgi:hypothetical protein